MPQEVIKEIKAPVHAEFERETTTTITRLRTLDLPKHPMKASRRSVVDLLAFLGPQSPPVYRGDSPFRLLPRPGRCRWRFCFFCWYHRPWKVVVGGHRPRSVGDSLLIVVVIFIRICFRVTPSCPLALGRSDDDIP